MKMNKRTVLLCLMFAVFSTGWSQTGSFGNTYVFNGGQTTIHSGNVNFRNGGNGMLPGIVGIDRTAPAGFIAFMSGASWSDASNKAHVDGYVRSYQTGRFVFPIGDNGIYNPAAVSEASLLMPTDAAYYGVDPTIAITSSLKGGNEPVLPAGGVFPVSQKGAGVTAVSTTGYWDINGQVAAKITLSWNDDTYVDALTMSDLKNLKIVGWNGAQWIEIPATVDEVAILGGKSTLASGSITTNETIVPDVFSVYTLASGACHLNAGIISGNQNICMGANAKLVTNGEAGGVWSSSDTTVASIDAATGDVKGLKAGLVTFTYTLNATSDCEGAVTNYAVVVEKCNDPDDIEVLNGITPNGDGINDMLVVKGLDKYPDNSVEVYNRWGIKVYSTTNYGQNNNYFRGISEGRATVQQDAGLPTGTYFYILKYINSNGDAKQKVGYLYLNRQ